MSKVLIVDDDITFCLMLETFLKKNGFQTLVAYNYNDALKKFNSFEPEVILTDLRLPDKDGIELLKVINNKNSDLPIILMTSYVDIKTAVKAMKIGAYDYVAKPINPDEILLTINKSLKDTSNDRNHSDSDLDFFINGISAASNKINEYVTLVASTSMSVLIMGDSGTGKEYVARKIHFLSDRAKKPFVAIDCGALPKDLAASELFGHVKGAFTGALSDKIGQFALANGGTLFLDEIGNLSYDIQVQLLRAIQERKIRQVGSNFESNIDTRLICATNEDLKKAVADGQFREDLYHRINEFSIFIPSLKNRPDDLELFAKHFLYEANQILNKNIVNFSSSVIDIFKKYEWPGNFRELRNVIKRAVLLSKTNTIEISALPEEIVTLCLNSERNKNIVDFIDNNTSLKGLTQQNERELIIKTLHEVRFNKSKAAELLSIDRKTLYNKMKQYNIPL